MKGRFNCPYCPWTGASDVMLARHQSMFHEALIAKEGEGKREREREITRTGFNPRLHNIVQGYLHGEDKGKVYAYDDEEAEGIRFYWRCVECNKVLKEWFEKWTPDSKERYAELKQTGRSSYQLFAQFPKARSILRRKI